MTPTMESEHNDCVRRQQVVEMMKEEGLQPNTYCMNSLMGVSVRARRLNTALEIFRQMERDGIPRDVVSAGCTVHSYARRSALRLATRHSRKCVRCVVLYR